MVHRLSSLALPRSCWFLSCSLLLGGLGGLRPPRSFPVFPSFFPASSLLFRVSSLLCLPSVLLSSSDLVPPCSPHGASVVLSQPCWFPPCSPLFLPYYLQSLLRSSLLPGYCASSLFLPGPPDTMPCQKLLNYVKKRSKMSSKIHPGSLQGTLLATPASTISNFFKFVQFWVSPGVPKALKLSPDGSPESTKLSKNCPQKPLQRKLPGTVCLKTPSQQNLHGTWSSTETESMK